MNLIKSEALLEPRHFSAPAPWAGHIPFASWLMSVQKPRTFVELGAYSGISYLAFCQAIKEQGLHTKAYAIDTWMGDAHAGAYGEGIYQAFRAAHDPHYLSFSTLLRMTFDEAAPRFPDASIDLLHIDGLHTYDAVRHDFDTWLPKLSSQAVVLLHDTNVFRDDFGVHELFAQLSVRYRSIEFAHSNGLGVLLVGPEQPEALVELCRVYAGTDHRPHDISPQRIFSVLGARFESRAERLVLENRLEDAAERESLLEQAGRQRHEWITQLDSHILDLQRSRSQNAIALAQLAQALDESQARARQLERTVKEIYASRSWRSTAWMRSLGSFARRIGAGAMLRRTRNAAGYVARGDWRALGQRIMSLRRESALARDLATVPGTIRRVGILATHHTLFVAHLIAQALERAGFQPQVFTEPEEGEFGLDAYFVVCPQMFKRLPPAGKRIAFQMEQTVSSRWFTPAYLKLLENSLAVLDYAQSNLEFLEKQGIAYPHTYLVPIGGFANYRDYLSRNGLVSTVEEPPCDVLFYGDANAPRRKQLLEAIGAQYHLRIVGEVFGAQLHRIIASAKVVVNLHYYEGALLETTRIYECLSLGAAVVSEASVDQHEHAALEGIVRFVPVGDEAGLLRAIGDELAAKQGACAAAHTGRALAVSATQARFEFMLYRMLLAKRWLDYDKFGKLTSAFSLPSDRVVLGLPETTQRRAMFVSHQVEGVEFFDGLRYSPGWIGCALSYKYLAQRALAAESPQLQVMEDDVLFPSDYASRKRAVDAFLEERKGQWDVFVGLVAIVHPELRVLKVERQRGEVFVTIDRMMSMVHNTYAPTALQLLARWNEEDHDPETNTIDRHLQKHPQLRIVTTFPFLVGHHEELHSSLWGIQNTQYRQLITDAQAQLAAKIEAFEAEQPL